MENEKYVKFNSFVSKLMDKNKLEDCKFTLETLKIIITNIINDPNNLKFRKFSLHNKKISRLFSIIPLEHLNPVLKFKQEVVEFQECYHLGFKLENEDASAHIFKVLAILNKNLDKVLAEIARKGDLTNAWIKKKAIKEKHMFDEKVKYYDDRKVFNSFEDEKKNLKKDDLEFLRKLNEDKHKKYEKKIKVKTIHDLEDDVSSVTKQYHKKYNKYYKKK